MSMYAVYYAALQSFILFTFWYGTHSVNGTQINRIQLKKSSVLHGESLPEELPSNMQSFHTIASWLEETYVNIKRRFMDALIDKVAHKKNKEEGSGYYEQYWVNKESVFLKTTTRPKWKDTTTLTPPGFARYVLGMGSEEREVHSNEMQINRDCNWDCPRSLYKVYGAVCAYRYNTRNWKTEYMEFTSLCMMEYYNCGWQQFRWMLLHRGKCPEWIEFKKNPTGGERDLVKNAHKYESHAESLLYWSDWNKKQRERNKFLKEQAAATKKS